MRVAEFHALLDEVGETPCMSAPVFFLPEEDNEQGTNYKVGKQLCAECPIKLECLDYALTQEIKYGLWGGLAPHERKRLNNARAA